MLEVGIGDPSNGAPTGISQRWPGSPWGGFSCAVAGAGAVASGATAAGAVSDAAGAASSGTTVVEGAGSTAVEQAAMAQVKVRAAEAQISGLFIAAGR